MMIDFLGCVVFNLPPFVVMSQYTLIGPAISTFIQYSPFGKISQDICTRFSWLNETTQL